MSLCPYCGRETNSDGFICADCSKQDRMRRLNTRSLKFTIDSINSAYYRKQSSLDFRRT